METMGRILVVDDQPEVRDVVSIYLASFGYSVQEACESEEALLCLSGGDTYAAAVIDVTMPGMDGWTLLEELRRAHPDLPVVMMSGFTQVSAEEKTARDPHAVFLAKPFPQESLEECLKQVMGGGNGN